MAGTIDYGPTVLWWGKHDPGYSRNRIIKSTFATLNWRCDSYRPRNPRLGYLQARLRGVASPDLIFVPCFCQRDITAACRFGRHHKAPVLIDPLISLYDTRVFERRTVPQYSRQARRLLELERRAFGEADLVIADTEAHGRYFSEALGVDPQKIVVVPVSAEEPLFSPAGSDRQPHTPVEVLFYGSFIPLQGVDVIAEAIRRYQGPPVQWRMLGGTNTTQRAECEKHLAGLSNVMFEDDISYTHLPARILRADILLGVFGTAEKTARVIPNKVYQALACGRTVITCDGPYPSILPREGSGLIRVPAGDPASLADAIAALAAHPLALPHLGRQARLSYEAHFSNRYVVQALAQALKKLALSSA